MKQYIVTNTSIPRSNVLLLTLRPKRLKDKLSFQAGQYAAIGFKKLGRRSPMRSFSIVSSPNDTNYLQFAMRIEGNFTQAMSKLVVGDEVFVQGPFGDFVVDTESDRQVVMLAAGIGITPFICMVRTMTERASQIPITLLYNIRTTHDIPFYEELLRLKQENSHLTVRFIASRSDVVSENSSVFINGPLSSHMLEQIPEITNTTYFVCGPKGYLKHARDLLDSYNVDPTRVITESFTQSLPIGASGMTPSKLTYVFASLVLFAGVGGIMLLDLTRAVPKLVSSQTASKVTTTNNTTLTQPTTTTPTTSSNVTTTPTTTPSNTAVTTPYSAPTTSVS